LKQVSEEIVYNSPFNMKMSVITFYWKSILECD
jgi:hypothetical protein